MRTPLIALGLDLPGYEVDEFVRLWSLKRRSARLIKLGIHASGYPAWQLSHRDRKIVLPVHRVVCLLHHGPPPSPEHEVCHKNDDKLDYSPTNLEWGTRSHNQRQAVANGKHRSGQRPGFDNSCCKMSPCKLEFIRRALARGEKQRDIARAVGVAQATISLINTGKRWVIRELLAAEAT